MAMIFAVKYNMFSKESRYLSMYSLFTDLEQNLQPVPGIFLDASL